MRKIKITAGKVEMEAKLNDSSVAKKIWEVLPIKGKANTWGEEIYFEIPVEAKIEKPQETVKEGDLGFWPPGNAFCIFFGPTPASVGGEIRPASTVEVIGKLLGNSKEFKRVSPNKPVSIEKIA